MCCVYQAEAPSGNSTLSPRTARRDRNGSGSTICSGMQAPGWTTSPSMSNRATSAAPAAAASAWALPRSVARLDRPPHLTSTRSANRAPLRPGRSWRRRAMAYRNPSIAMRREAPVRNITARNLASHAGSMASHGANRAGIEYLVGKRKEVCKLRSCRRWKINDLRSAKGARRAILAANPDVKGHGQLLEEIIE